MSDKTFTLPAWLPESLREDPKKTGVLSALAMVLLVLVAHWTLGGPSKATAAVPTKPETALTTSPARANNQVIPQQFADEPVRAWVKRPVAIIPRNLFLVRTELYPRATPVPQETPAAQPTFWDAVGKSQAQQADENKQRLVLVQNMQREAAKLELQSTIMGPIPQAIISGSMVREGSLVSADGTSVQFQIVKIEARDVIVERDGIQLRLRMTP